MKALPLLLLGGAAVYFATKKPTKATANGVNGLPSGTEGVIQWRVIATGRGTYIAQWKRPKDTRWNDAGEANAAEDAAAGVVEDIKAGEIP